MSKNEIKDLLSQGEIDVNDASEIQELTSEQMAEVTGGIGGKGGVIHPDLNIACNGTCRKPVVKE